MTGPSLEETDPRLLDVLRRAGDEWGPAGVARAAAMLARTPDTPPDPLTCPTCRTLVDPDHPDPGHDVVYRYNTPAGPGPYPFLALHSYAHPQKGGPRP